MKIRNTLLIMFTMLMCCFAFASADVNITNCSQLNSSDTYYLQADLDATAWTDNFGRCLEVNNDNVIIDCQGFKIQGNPTYSSYESIYISNNENLTIMNCEFVGGIRGVVIDTADNVYFENNTFRDMLFVGSDAVGYAIELQGDITVPVLFYNNTVTDSDALVLLSHTQTDSSDIVIYHNNLLELEAYAIILNYDESKGRVLATENAYNLPEACIDFGEDGTCDYAFGDVFYIDSQPIQCIDGWRDGTTGCSYSRFQYDEADLSKSIIDNIVKIAITFGTFMILIVLFLGFMYINSKIILGKK